MTEPLEFAFDVGCSPEHAFDVWASRTSQWWPPDHTVSGERGMTVTVVHRGWERLGASSGERRRRNQAGWAGLLPRYRDACAAV